MMAAASAPAGAAPELMTVSLTALVVVLLASLSWSGLDLLRKLLVARISPLPLLFFLTAGMLPAFAVWVAWTGGATIAAGYWLPAGGSVLLNVAANLAFFQAVRRSPLSVTIPMLSLTPVFVLLLAMPLLGEVPSWTQGAGIALTVAGALLLNLGAGDVTPAAWLRALRREPGSLLMMLVALLWSAAVPCDKLAVERASSPLHALLLAVGIGAITLIVLAAQRRLGELRSAARAPGLLAAALAASVLGLGLQLVAIQLVWVAFVETVKRGFGNTLAVVLGRLVFGEPLTPYKVLAVALMALGVAATFAG